MRPFHWIVVWLSACVAPGYRWLRSRRSILVFDQSDASGPFYSGGGFLAQRPIMTCSAPAALIFFL